MMAEWPRIVFEIVAAAFTAAATLIVGAWKLRGWLGEEFAKRERANQKRHEQNLSHFRRIYVALATLGYRGGSGDSEQQN